MFETIAAEDLEYMDDAGSDTERPAFGDSNSSYEEVVSCNILFNCCLVILGLASVPL